MGTDDEVMSRFPQPEALYARSVLLNELELAVNELREEQRGEGRKRPAPDGQGKIG